MVRRGVLRSLNAVVQQSLQAYECRVLTLGQSSPSDVRQVFRRLGGHRWFSGGVLLPRASPPQLPLDPRRFSASNSQAHGLVGQLLRRLFSSQNKPRGFERFVPRSSLKAGAKVEPRKPADAGPGGNKEGGDPQEPTVVSVPFTWLLLGAALLYYWASSGGLGGAAAGPRHEISFQEFRAKLLAKGMVTRLEVVNHSLVRVFVRADSGLEGVGPAQGVFKYFFQVGSLEAFERKLEDAQRELGLPYDAFVSVKYVNEVNLGNALLELLPTLLLVGATYWMISRQMRSMGGGFPGGLGGRKGGKAGGGGFFGMVRANTGTLDKATKEKLTFKDVAGCDEAKAEIMEFVEFLKKPDKFKDLGAKIPKGALLVGPPGTGKTLLAKATAGEAGVPFLSISGSDFMEMFVGVGPARVRDLFAQARSQNPSIIFIDEIDAIGRARGRGGQMGGNDERENTLNQLLVEMDGFSTTQGVVVLAGTNRPDILDKALLRPGRFDRTITVDTPDIKGRIQIFRVHLGKLKLSEDVEFYAERLAALTPGMSGADIANVCNEGALVAARSDKASIDMVDFEQAIDRVIGGLEKKNKVINAEERRTVAFHESGHAVVSWFLEHAEPLLKVSIVPRGTSVLGFAQYLPSEGLLLTKEQLLDRICAILGGRAAEQVLLGKISTGAVNDLERITQMAYSQVAVYGMNDKVGLLSYRMDRDAFDKPYSNETAHMIDTEVRDFVDSAYKRTLALVEQHKDLITAMSMDLLKKEVLNLDDIERLLGVRPFQSMELRNIDRFRYGAGGKAKVVDAEVVSQDGGAATGVKTPGEGGDDDEPGVTSSKEAKQGSTGAGLKRKLGADAVIAS